ncbi:MAG TPA: hypothetical protein DEP35_05670 [Deltaproteobacteria bacterium]|nr:hypothetical protein [Deltaproteobacteria bacterium]
MAGVRKRVSVAAFLAAGLFAAAGQAGEDPAARLAAPDATADRMPGEQRARPRSPAERVPAAGGGEVGLAPATPPLAARRPCEQTTLEWLQRFGAVEARPIVPSERGEDPF